MKTEVASKGNRSYKISFVKVEKMSHFLHIEGKTPTTKKMNTTHFIVMVWK